MALIALFNLPAGDLLQVCLFFNLPCGDFKDEAIIESFSNLRLKRYRVIQTPSLNTTRGIDFDVTFC